MAEERALRRLAAILAADVVGYSRLMQADEAGTVVALRARRREILEPLIAQHHGRVVKLMGDGALVDFASAVDAVECAARLQEAMGAANAELPDDQKIVWRIGINLGDVVVEDGDLYGDGVNIAARLEALAEPGGVFLSQTVFGHVRGKVDFEFEDLGEQNLKNMADPVRVYRLARLGASPKAMTEGHGLPSKPSIAVLPFINMSDDSGQEFFVDGLTEDIITALSRISALWVISRASTFTYKGKPTDARRIAKELGVRYVMEGSVRRVGDRLRVTAQLIDAATGHHVWAERYDRSLTDVFDIQDDITRSVAASTETQVYLAERQAAESRPSADVKARDLVSRASGKMYDQTPEAIAEASHLVEEALRIDPSTPRAHFLRGHIFLNRMYFGEIPRDAANSARALELAATALRLAPHDELAHWLMAGALAEAGRLEDALAECERGLEINPSCSIIVARMGTYLGTLGRPQEAIEACRLALRLNPRDPESFWRHSDIAVAHFVAADYDAALQESKSVIRLRPPHPLASLQCAIIWAAAAAALEKVDEARRAVEYCLVQRPELRVDNILTLRFAHEEVRTRLLALLRKAGLPG